MGPVTRRENISEVQLSKEVNVKVFTSQIKSDNQPAAVVRSHLYSFGPQSVRLSPLPPHHLSFSLLPWFSDLFLSVCLQKRRMLN